MWSVQLSLGVLTILTMTLYIPSTHGEPFLLQGKLESRLDDTENRVLPEREDTNHEDTLLTLLLNKKLAWRRPENIGKNLLLRFLKDTNSEEGSEVAYALESLSASQPKKRGKFCQKLKQRIFAFI
uniref:Urotensin 2B n=1 Tax=Strix occidentalis caurina TaxID=311401 RepID=A0A8D0F0V0_STROC